MSADGAPSDGARPGARRLGGTTARGGLRFDEAVLPGGLRVIGEHNPHAASTAAAFMVETGGRDEDPDEHGVSHFLEHLLFKGTETMDGGAVSRTFDALGARYNAFTSDERTVYYGAVLPDAALDLVDLLTQMMRPALREDDVELERKVVLEEIAMDRDRPSWVVFDRARDAYFRGHPIGRSLLGTEASLRALDAERIRAYLRRRYAPGNVLAVLAGRYDWEEVLGRLERGTASWEPAPAGREVVAIETASGERVERTPRLQRVHVAMLAPGVGRDDPRRLAAALLARTIGDHDNSRLFWALVEPGLAEEASLWHDEAHGLGTFQAYLSTDAGGAERALAVAAETLDGVQQGGVEPHEWAMAQRALATSLTLRGETPMGRLVTLGSAYLDRGRYESVRSTVDELLETPLDAGLALLAERPFDRRLTYVLSPGEAT